MKTELTQALKKQDSTPTTLVSASAAEKRTQTVIQPTLAWQWPDLRELWEYRDLLFFLMWRDLKARYRQTALGPLWIVLQPLMSMVLYSVLFGAIAKLPSEGQPYAVFSYTALLPWGFFSGAFGDGVNGLFGSVGLISKVYFPRLVIPLANTISSLVDLAISFVILLVMLVVYGIRPTWGIVCLPLFLLISAASGMGIGLWFSGVRVKYRDIGQFTNYLMRAWMYATPVVYSIDMVPENWRPLYRLNPMVTVIEGFRWALLGSSPPPDWIQVVLASVLSVIFLAVGFVIFKRSERTIVDVA